MEKDLAVLKNSGWYSMIHVYTRAVDKAMDVLLADLIKCCIDNYYLLQSYFKSADITTWKLTHRLMILTEAESKKQKAESRKQKAIEAIDLRGIFKHIGQSLQ